MHTPASPQKKHWISLYINIDGLLNTLTFVYKKFATKTQTLLHLISNILKAYTTTISVFYGSVMHY
jgi:hypothetical protein